MDFALSYLPPTRVLAHSRCSVFIDSDEKKVVGGRKDAWADNGELPYKAGGERVGHSSKQEGRVGSLRALRRSG